MSVPSSSRTRSLSDLARAVLMPDRRASTLLVAVCLSTLALAIRWRAVRLGFPSFFTFDENHFVENARNYIRQRADWNDHPPLGKLILVPSLLAFGDTSLAWRLPAMVFGIAFIAIAYFTGVSLFQKKRAGMLAATFVASDGFFIAFSRTALLDIPMATFMASSFLLMVEPRTLRRMLGAAVLLGLAVSIKWTAGCLFLVMPMLLMRQGRSGWHALWMLAVIALVYIAVEWFALDITFQSPTIDKIVALNWSLLKHHAGFTDWHNPADSRWYTWPFLTHPIFLYFAKDQGQIRAMSTVGNPFLWYGVTAGFVFTIAGWLAATYRKAARRIAFPAVIRMVDQRPRLYGLLLLTAAVLLVPWYFTERESYIWHYLTSYYFGILLLVGILVSLFEDRPWAVLAFVTVVAAVSIFYAPVWTNARLTESAFHWRFFAWGK